MLRKQQANRAQRVNPSVFFAASHCAARPEFPHVHKGGARRGYQGHLRKRDPQSFSGTVSVLLIALNFYFQLLFLGKSPLYVHFFMMSVHKGSSEIKKNLKYLLIDYSNAVVY